MSEDINLFEDEPVEPVEAASGAMTTDELLEQDARAMGLEPETEEAPDIIDQKEVDDKLAQATQDAEEDENPASKRWPHISENFLPGIPGTIEKNSLCISIGFDGIICLGDEDWTYRERINGRANPEAFNVLKKYEMYGFNLNIMTPRAANQMGASAISVWLENNDVGKKVLQNAHISDKVRESVVFITDKDFCINNGFPTINEIMTKQLKLDEK